MSETAKNKPKNSRFYQQRLPAWTPILTIRDAIIFFFVSGIIALILGLVIYFTQNTIVEYVYDYTDCNDCPTKLQKNGNCSCTISINLTKTIDKPVYMFYGLSGFYQNHRQYMKSYSSGQLMGTIEVTGISDDTCEGYRKNDTSGNYYAPCGIMANSIFNDTFSFTSLSSTESIVWSKVDIALASDKMRYGEIKSWNNTEKPMSWPLSAQERSNTSYKGDEELLVWMRPAALPNFRKLYRKLDTSSSNAKFSNGLPNGIYNLVIDYSYPVTAFGGRKFFVITNLSWLGGKNLVLAGLYLAAGCGHLIIGVVLLIIFSKGRSNIPESNSMMLQTKL